MAGMAMTEYVRPLGENARLRHRHETRKGVVTEFAIQLEVCSGGAWVPIVRYDTAHRRPHVDVYLTERRRTKQFLDLSLAEALTLADEDIKENWERYRDAFLRRTER
jgi:hypothetical protein